MSSQAHLTTGMVGVGLLRLVRAPIIQQLAACWACRQLGLLQALASGLIAPRSLRYEETVGIVTLFPRITIRLTVGEAGRILRYLSDTIDPPAGNTGEITVGVNICMTIKES